MLEYFLDPHPDEILYSVWARFSDHVGYPTVDVLHELFGNRSIRPILDLPCYLQNFVDRLPLGHCYDVDYFIDRHTLLPFYSAFLSSERLQRVREQMACGTTKSIHQHVGNNIGVMPPIWLRFCPRCVEQDRNDFGECFWHRLHQLPGVEICPLHAMFLENSSVRTRYGNLSQTGLLSAESAVRDINSRLAGPSPFFNALLGIAQDSDYLLKHPHLHLGTDILAEKYRATLAHQGFLTKEGKVRLHDLSTAFAEYYSQDLLRLLHCEIKLSGQLDGIWLAKILRPHINESKIVHHPLYHILVVRFLGSSLETFLSQDISFPKPFGSGPWPCLNPVCEYYLQGKILTYQVSETRMKDKIVGRFACDCGYTYSRAGPDTSPNDVFRKGQVRSYGKVWETKLRELWFDPTVSKTKIADILGTSRLDLNRHAERLQLPVPRWSSPTTVTDEALQRRTGKDRLWYRTQWLAIVADAPEVSPHMLARQRRVARILYWLRRYDRVWLHANSPSKKKHSEDNTLSKTPEKIWRLSTNRDALLADSVRTAAKKLENEQGFPKRVSKRSVCQEVPELRWMPSAQRAPLTAQAFRDVTESFEDFALRRVRWAQAQYTKEQTYPSRNAFIERAHLRKAIHRQTVQQALNEALETLSQFA